MVRQSFLVAVLRCSCFLAMAWRLHIPCFGEDAVLADDDPIAAAERRRAAIDAAGAAFDATAEELLATLNATIARIPRDARYTNFVDERRALDEMKSLVRRLIADSDAVRAKFEPFLQSGDDYAVQLKTAGPYFASAANEFRQYAELEPYENYRADYQALASVFDLLAERCEQMPSEIVPQLEEARELLNYLASGRQFLARCQSALDAIPKTLDKSVVNEMLASLKSYATSYENFRQSLRSLQGQLDSNAAPQPVAGEVVRRGTRGTIMPSTERRPSTRAPLHLTVAVQSSPKRHIVAFDGRLVATGGAPRYRMAVIDAATIAIGDVVRVKLRGGGTKLVRIRDEVPALRQDAEQTWLAAEVHPRSGGVVKLATEF